VKKPRFGGAFSLRDNTCMPHLFEPAASGRSKCRGCRQPLAKGELRFGESLPNPFGEGEVMHWFHPRCAAYTSEPVLEALQAAGDVADREALESIARAGIERNRLQRIDGAERASTGQAKCRQCHEPIEKGSWRVRLVFHDEGALSPGGFIHLACGQAYFEIGDIAAPLLHFSVTLAEHERAALRMELERGDDEL
jgi:hypothetical protein